MWLTLLIDCVHVRRTIGIVLVCKDVKFLSSRLSSVLGIQPVITFPSVLGKQNKTFSRDNFSPLMLDAVKTMYGDQWGDTGLGAFLEEHPEVFFVRKKVRIRGSRCGTTQGEKPSSKSATSTRYLGEGHVVKIDTFVSIPMPGNNIHLAFGYCFLKHRDPIRNNIVYIDINSGVDYTIG